MVILYRMHINIFEALIQVHGISGVTVRIPVSESETADNGSTDGQKPGQWPGDCSEQQLSNLSVNRSRSLMRVQAAARSLN